MSTAEVFSTLGNTMMSGGYHEYTGECSIHWSFHTKSVVFPMTFPTFIVISPTVLMMSPGVLHRHYPGWSCWLLRIASQ